MKSLIKWSHIAEEVFSLLFLHQFLAPFGCVFSFRIQVGVFLWFILTFIHTVVRIRVIIRIIGIVRPIVVLILLLFAHSDIFLDYFTVIGFQFMLDTLLICLFIKSRRLGSTRKMRHVNDFDYII